MELLNYKNNKNDEINSVKKEHFEHLMENNIHNTIQLIFEHNLLKNNDFIYPIVCFSQKEVFYVYETKWRQLMFDDMILILKKIQTGIIKEITKWKENNKQKFNDNDNICILFNKAIIKVTNISFRQDNNFSKIKNNLYNYLKTDLKSTVEFDF